jgi:shikimate dehydrogenase
MGESRCVRVGLIGAGIQASRSPVMHEREGARQGLDYSYRLIDLEALDLTVEALPRLVEQAQAECFAGLNITHPCKQAVIPLLDGLSPDARDIGAVNTVVFEAGGRRVGHNTDWWGFTESLRRGLGEGPLGAVLQLGAGGAGSATAHALMKRGVERLLLYDTDAARAAALAEALNARFAGEALPVDDPVAAAGRVQGLVQTTPVGMKAHPGTPLPPAALRRDHWLAEVVYFPLETELLQAARALGCRTVDGAGMAVFQAVGAFELFTGLTPDPEAMARDLFDQTPA